MKHELFSYRFAKEIIEHPTHEIIRKEIIEAVEKCPVYIYPNKSENESLDVVQQLLNSFFDRELAVENHWEYHPRATDIEASGLEADFKKTEKGIGVQIEIQFGNMARWYSDLFKFQAAYSANMINLGVSIVPFKSLADRIDSNVTQFERCKRELPAADLSITLPILLIGLSAEDTETIDVSTSQFDGIKGPNGIGTKENRFRIINGFLEGTPITDIGPDSEPGPIPQKVGI